MRDWRKDGLAMDRLIVEAKRPVSSSRPTKKVRMERTAWWHKSHCP
jgi:hypothetical protein